MLVILAIIGVAVFVDARNRSGSCEAPNPKASGYLTLTGVEADPKILKAAFLVPIFKRSKDKLVVGTASDSVGRFSYDPVIDLEPDGITDIPRRYIDVQLPYHSSSFWYPFDRPELELVIDFQKDFQPEKGGTIVPLKMQIENKVSGLILEPCIPRYSLEDVNAGITTNRFSISLHRHRFIQIIAGIFLVVALTFLCYIGLSEDRNKVLSSSLGYMAALWGVRQIIVGSEKVFPTIVDFVTLGLYIVVALIVFHKVLFGSNPGIEISKKR